MLCKRHENGIIVWAILFFRQVFLLHGGNNIAWKKARRRIIHPSRSGFTQTAVGARNDMQEFRARCNRASFSVLPFGLSRWPKLATGRCTAAAAVTGAHSTILAVARWPADGQGCREKPWPTNYMAPPPSRPSLYCTRRRPPRPLSVRTVLLLSLRVLLSSQSLLLLLPHRVCMVYACTYTLSDDAHGMCAITLSP